MTANGCLCPLCLFDLLCEMKVVIAESCSAYSDICARLYDANMLYIAVLFFITVDNACAS